MQHHAFGMGLWFVVTKWLPTPVQTLDTLKLINNKRCIRCDVRQYCGCIERYQYVKTILVKHAMCLRPTLTRFRGGPTQPAACWVTFTHPPWEKIQRPPFGIYVENDHFDWLNRCLHTAQHFQSDLNIFRFDFIFTEPHDGPPMFCFNVQTDTRFLLQ